MTEGQEKSTPQREVGHFAICAEMAKRNMDIRMSLLENVTDLRYEKRTKGTAVTIGVDGNLVAAIVLEQKFIGGLLLCDKEQYFKLADELRSVAGGEPQEGKHSYDALWDRAFAECVLTKYGGPECPQEPDSVKSGLKYIADSPPKEHGGFHPQTIEIAKQALARIEQLEAGGEPEQWISVEERFPPDDTPCLVVIGKVVQHSTARYDGDEGWEWIGNDWAKNAPVEIVSHWRALPAPPQGKEQK